METEYPERRVEEFYEERGFFRLGIAQDQEFTKTY